MRDLTAIKNVLHGEDLTLEEANTAAQELSVKHWNMYFFVFKQDNGEYRMSRYNDNNAAIHHYICGKKYDSEF